MRLGVTRFGVVQSICVQTGRAYEAYNVSIVRMANTTASKILGRGAVQFCTSDERVTLTDV